MCPGLSIPYRDFGGIGQVALLFKEPTFGQPGAKGMLLNRPNFSYKS
jgi:hypothetical protein